MSINGALTTFGIASMKIMRVSLQLWLIIQLSPTMLRQTWLWHHPAYVVNMSVNGASTTFGLQSWKMQGLHGGIKLSSNYRPPFYTKLIATTLLRCPRNECQQRVNDFWPCILENARVVRWHWSMIDLSAAFLRKNGYVKIVSMSHNEGQQSINNPWSCILDNLTAMECR